MCSERGVARREGQEKINVGVMENNVSGRIVRDGGLSARRKELAFSLKVRDFGMKFSLEEREFSKGFVKECSGRRMGAKRVSKESDVGGNFGGGVPRVGVKEGESTLEMIAISF